MPSSTGAAPKSGISACSASESWFGFAHKSVERYATFVSVSALRKCDSPVEPRPVSRPSVKARSCTWQLAHDCVSFSERRVS
jgi:hypothetical protein